jgi:PKD repeat protein
MRRVLVLFSFLSILLLTALGRAGSGLAAAPSNDNFAGATAVASLPFSGTADTTEATLEDSEPFGCSSYVADVWYRIAAPATESLRITFSPSDGQIWAGIYQDTGGGIPGLSRSQCLNAWTPSVVQTIPAGETYYIQIARGYFAYSNSATLSIELVGPPANDDFGDAATITGLPYVDNVDTSGASVEANEPILCTPPASEKTVWYAYTPTASESVTARITSSPGPTGLAAYTGSSLSTLTSLGCQYGFPLVMKVTAGTTYYFQVGLWGSYGGQVQFTLDVSPSPVASFYTYPSNPSTSDRVSFIDQSYDPAGAGISVEDWNFGDGTTTTEFSPLHRYTSDGDYTVSLLVTTPDGRTASTSQTVSVQTHDVSIMWMSTPSKGKVGKAAPIEVGIGNTHYPETVWVDFYRSTPTGFQWIGTVTKSVPAMKAQKTGMFSWDYTFTTDDLAVGKVNFEAIANIQGTGDAYWSDNTAISLATQVTR